MPLVDTSVWVSHFRYGNEHLVEMLEAGEAMCHPLVIGELACGHLENRREVLMLMHALPSASVIEHDEALDFIETQALWGKGLGYVDVQLLASARLTGVPLWTLDKKLENAAAQSGWRYEGERPAAPA